MVCLIKHYLLCHFSLEIVYLSLLNFRNTLQSHFFLAWYSLTLLQYPDVAVPRIHQVLECLGYFVIPNPSGSLHFLFIQDSAPNVFTKHYQNQHCLSLADTTFYIFVCLLIYPIFLIIL